MTVLSLLKDTPRLAFSIKGWITKSLSEHRYLLSHYYFYRHWHWLYNSVLSIGDKQHACCESTPQRASATPSKGIPFLLKKCSQMADINLLVHIRSVLSAWTPCSKSPTWLSLQSGAGLEHANWIPFRWSQPWSGTSGVHQCFQLLTGTLPKQNHPKIHSVGA